MNAEIMKDIESFAEENGERLFKDIARLVAINSVESKPEPDAPFGAGAKLALEEALKISAELGLDTKDCEGMIGYASVGESEKYLATITHLDIVPAGEGWKEDPFTMREREGYIIGRGVMDDKGPSVLCLYALKYLKDRNIPLRYQVRALLGINEETGMKDVLYYLDNYPAPAFCFSPDADFPLCNGEKGICGGVIRSNHKAGNVQFIKGGFVTNAVPDKAEALVKCAGRPEETERVKVSEENGLFRLNAEGIAGHASMPQGTINAIGLLVDFILDNGIADENEKPFFELLRKLHSATDGSGLGVQADDGLFKPLTIIGGMIGMEDGRIYQTIDSRYPTNTSGRRIIDGIRAVAGDAAEVTLKRDSEPFYMSLDNPAVQVCVKAYNDVTGENAEPYTIGGGTYARDFPNAVSFGPEHPERPMPDFAGPIHGVDEAAGKDALIEALKIYIYALLELEKLDF